ncbi:AAA family ATPase [Bradyrhizobium sp. ISRA435]|nr:AAA family ATPase [Bradyrhizobium sp. ISRA435]
MYVDRTEDRSLPPEVWRDGLGFRIALAKIRQHRPALLRLLLVGVTIGGMAGLAYGAIRVPVFSATSELLISNTTLQMSGPDAVVTQVLVENSLIQSAIEMLRSSRVLDRVVDKIGLEKTEEILPRSSLAQAIGRIGWQRVRDLLQRRISGSEEALSDERRRQKVLARMRSDMAVSRVGASLIISVRARARSPDEAARLTNELAASFVQEQNDTSAVVSTSASLRERIKVLGPTARIISEAVPPTSSDGPPTAVILPLAPAVGGMLACIVGLGLALFDRSLRSAEQLVALTSVECFGALPRTKVPQMNRLGLASTLRRSVLQRARSAVLETSNQVPHFVGVTSYCPGEGKTVVAGSWARFLAGDGSRVLLVDAGQSDTRPALRPVAPQVAGLHEVLRGEVAPGDAIQSEISPNLDFLPSGEALSNLDMLWGNLAYVINAGRECAYEWVILDLPPLATAADVRSAGQIIDSLLIVVEWGHASEAELSGALSSLGSVRGRILGTVLNKVPRSVLRSETLVRTRRRSGRPQSLDLTEPGDL